MNKIIKKEFIEHLEKCSKKVRRWPKWKREILGTINKTKEKI